MAKGKTTSDRVAKVASKALKTGKATTKQIRTLAGSALAQDPKKRAEQAAQALKQKNPAGFPAGLISKTMGLYQGRSWIARMASSFSRQSQ